MQATESDDCRDSMFCLGLRWFSMVSHGLGWSGFNETAGIGHGTKARQEPQSPQHHQDVVQMPRI